VEHDTFFDADENSEGFVRPETPADEIDTADDSALRPASLADFNGQETVKEQLELLIASAKSRDDVLEHLLFSGAPGLGKTTLSMIIASEMGGQLKVTSGPSLTHVGDLASILSTLEPGDVLFIDEIHRIAKPVAEMLYIAMEDFRVDVIVGKGIGASSISLPLPKFTLIGATTRSGLLPTPLLDRFGFVGQLDYYTPAELADIVNRSATLLGVAVDHDAALEIASRSRGTARIANRLLRRVRDWAHIHNDDALDLNSVRKTLALFEVDEDGLDKIDQKVLKAIVKKFDGGPVGIATLASAVSEEPQTIEAVVEPYLVRQGYLNRTPQGRVATFKAREKYEQLL
jgi:Holliday junction DNA helicase RuvB